MMEWFRDLWVTLLTGRLPVRLAPVRVRRGVTFLEYVLIAAIVVVILILLRGQITRIWNEFVRALNSVLS